MLNQHRARSQFKLASICLVAVTLGISAAQPLAVRSYFPPRGEWRTQEPAAVGVDKTKLDEAITFAIAHENSETKDLAAAIPNQFRNEAPYNTLIGPTQPRTGANGLIIRRGSVNAEWGNTDRADMTFSVTKTFLSTVVGLAFDRGQIRSVTDRVAIYMPRAWISLPRPTMLRSPGNISCVRRATGPARSGANRIGPTARLGIRLPQWEQRELHEAGPFYKYNDTRINVLALAALYVLKRPLPEVLDESIMTTIGASSSWHWEASDNAWVEIDGRRMKSVTGGGHFGGGMFVNAYDMARLPVPPTRRMGGSPGDLEEVDRDGEVARAGESHFRVLQLVSEQSLQGIRRDGRPSISIGASFVRYVSGQWYQRHLPGITIS